MNASLLCTLLSTLSRQEKNEASGENYKLAEKLIKYSKEISENFAFLSSGTMTFAAHKTSSAGDSRKET